MGRVRHANQVCVADFKRADPLAHDLAELASEPVSGHGISRAPTNGIGDLRQPVIGSSDPSDPYWSVAARPNPRQLGKARTVANSVNQAESRARPRARRDLSTARPARLRIRRRKPCFFLRFRLLGWKVRFTHGLLEEGNRPQRLERRRSRTRRGGAERRELRVAGASIATRSQKGLVAGHSSQPVGVSSALESTGPPDTQRAIGGLLPHAPRAPVASLGTTPPCGVNYSHDVLDCSLESPWGACYGRPPTARSRPRPVGEIPRNPGLIVGRRRSYEPLIHGVNGSPHMWMGLWKFLSDV